MESMLKHKDMLNSMSIAAFKTATNANAMQVLRNPKTNKLFVSLDTGINIKCEQAIDVSKDMSVLVEDGDLENACLINTRTSAEVLATL